MERPDTSSKEACSCPSGSLTVHDEIATCGDCTQRWLVQRDGPVLAIPPREGWCAKCDQPQNEDGHCAGCMHLLGPIYVNEYVTRRIYGGPEEGGWWFDAGEFVRTHAICATKGEAKAAVRKLGDYLRTARRGQYEPSSVLCRGYTELQLETHPGRNYPTETPRYE